MSTSRKMGWKPELPDARDKKYTSVTFAATQRKPLPPSVDLRKAFPYVYDQGNLGSCTAQAIGAVLDYQHKRKAGSYFGPSKLFIYYNEREMEGTVARDEGAQIRSGIKSVNKIGACREEVWPYQVTKFKRKPSKEAYTDALNYQSISYERLDHTDLHALKDCLFNTNPFVFGITLYESFYQAERTGVVPMPAVGRWDDPPIGGHAMVCCGYNDERKSFIVRNSWGDQWGFDGYCYIPYAYMTDRNLGADYWTIKEAE